jgi:ubiquinone biosynthesis protein COQ9
MQADIENLIFENFMKNLPFEGWTQENLKLSSKQAKQPADFGELLFLNGVDDVFKKYTDHLLQSLTAGNAHGTTAKIKAALHSLFKELAKNRIATTKTVTYLLHPWNIEKFIKFNWCIADYIWTEVVCDTSTDFNYYTKRTLLAMVVKSSLLYYISDDSFEHSDTIDFIDRKLNDVLRIGKFVSSFCNV